MTGRANKRVQKKKTSKQVNQAQQQNTQADDSQVSSPPNIRKEQPPAQQVVKKILKAENDEARTLKTVFKSNPDAQMKDFIRNAASKPVQQAVKAVPKTPADTHTTAVAQELLETDDMVADNLGKLFKASKSYKNL